MTDIVLDADRIHEGDLILINRRYPCQFTADTTLVPVAEQSTVLYNKKAAVLLNELMSTIHGWDFIVPVSGARSFTEQQKIWNDSLTANGSDYTKTYVALPGHSEHETGLAIDLGLRQEPLDFICPAFPYTGICQKFREESVNYGFIERYPSGKEDITGIGHEPWHFRYVGIPHAKIMTDLALTLEEYLPFLEQFRHGMNPYHTFAKGREILVSYQAAAPGGETKLSLDTRYPYSISGNNVNGFLITEWR